MILSSDQVQDLYYRALDSGRAVRTAATSVTWNIAGSCKNPQPVPVVGRPSRHGHKYVGVPSDGVPFFVDLETRCRKCVSCLAYRQGQWTRRATSEIAFGAGRTWMLTLTVSPHWRFHAKAQASVLARSRGIADLESEDRETQFRYIAKVMGPWITKYLKRVRKEYAGDDYPARFRYMIIAEPHKNGFPHFHALLHEADAGRPITYRRLARWSWGHIKAKLAWSAPEASGYLAKYLAKAMLTRVRASKFYGLPLKAVLTVVARKVQRATSPSALCTKTVRLLNETIPKWNSDPKGDDFRDPEGWTVNGKRSLFKRNYRYSPEHWAEPQEWEFDDHPRRWFVPYVPPPDVPF